MAAVAVFLVWASYSAGLMGYSLVRGYDNHPLAMLNPIHPATWSTNLYTGPSIFPDGKSAAGANEGSGGSLGGSGVGSGGPAPQPSPAPGPPIQFPRITPGRRKRGGGGTPQPNPQPGPPPRPGG